MKRESRWLSVATFPGTTGRFFFNRIIILVSLSAVAVVTLGVFGSRSLATLNQGTEWVIHTQMVRYQLAHVLQLLADMGGDVRRFEATRDEQLLQDSQRAVAQLSAELDALHRVLRADPTVLANEADLRAAIEHRVRTTQTLIDMARTGGSASLAARAENIAALVRCRALVAKMQDEEKRIFDLHRRISAAARDSVAFAILATTGLAVVLLVLVAYVSMRHSARLQHVQNDLATTLRSIGDAVIATDAEGAVRLMNPVAEQLTGWTHREAHGRPLHHVFQIIDEQTRVPLRSPVERVAAERKTVGLTDRALLISRDADERPIEDSAAPIHDTDGTLVGVVLVFRDATVQRAASRALMASEAASREADRRKDVFLATLSHELRNPLAPIRNAARLLESSTLTEPESQRARLIISRQVRQMASLLDDLLDVSRITRGALTLKKEIVSLKEIFEAAVETARPAIDAKRHALSVEWPDERIRLEVDPLRLTQVVTNLLTNAAKYTDPEGRIVLESRIEARTIVIRVRDTGIGIAPEMLSGIFEMFSQVAPGKGHAEGGLGIGLALAKGLVELHGGRIEARSNGLEQGSEFLVSFPDAWIEAAAPAVTAGGAEPAPSRARPLRVLIADDNRDSAESLGLLLELSGHDVLLAHDGVSALALAAAKLPDVALLDIGMPGMDGYEVAAHIRRESWGSALTLIAITGWGQDVNKRMARSAGFDHHLTKPMDSKVLESLLAAVPTAS
ncbi:MAG: ATP-binding protein [Pseudomonadota bacterium]|nr:ATP-binding protein [Pseudomonadota bacterium]